MGYWNMTYMELAGNMVGMLLCKQSQREGIYAKDVGPVDAFKPIIKTKKETTAGRSNTITPRD